MTKAKLLAALFGSGMALMLTSGCGPAGLATPADPRPSLRPSEAVRLALPSSGPTSTLTSVATEIPGNIYQNSVYRFTFEIPEGWSLDERTWPTSTGGQAQHALVLTKGDYEIIFEFTSVFDSVRIGPTGLPAGVLMVIPDELTVFGRPASEYVLVYEDRVKVVFYDIRFEDFRGFLVLQQVAGSDGGTSYEETDLPDDVRLKLRTLLASLSRTGMHTLPESVAMLAEFPVILPMERSYYSQVFDTSVANACGPAVAIMVLDFYELEDSFQTVIDKLQALPGPGAFDPNCYVNTVCTSPASLAAVLADYGLDARLHENWTLPEVLAVIASGNPIIADILWDEATESLGHFVVIYGVDLDQELIYYHDPYRGSEMTAAWDDFASLWEGRVDVGDPLASEGHRFWGLEVRLPAGVGPGS